MEKRNVYRSKQQDIALKKLSEETGISVSEHIRRAIDYYLKFESGEKFEYIVREAPAPYDT